MGEGISHSEVNLSVRKGHWVALENHFDAYLLYRKQLILCGYVTANCSFWVRPDYVA